MIRCEQGPIFPAGPSFFARHHLTVARELIGCQLFWDGVSGKIVETEAYAVEGDAACHTAFRPSAREFFAANSPGTAYVYLNYGVHWMLNVLTLDGIILIRALEPLSGLELMRKRRGSGVNDRMLCSGPGRLGKALNLSRFDHGTSLLSDSRHVVTTFAAANSSLACSDTEHTSIHQVVCDKRVGIRRAADRLWRFLLADHPCVSVPQGKVKSNP